VSCAGGPKEFELDDAAGSIHFAPADARPIALAIVEEAGAVKGTTKTLDREVFVWDLRPLLEELGDNRRIAWELDVCTRVSFITASFDCVNDDGMGSILDPNRTEY
jgi:hypothetical protein